MQSEALVPEMMWSLSPSEASGSRAILRNAELDLEEEIWFEGPDIASTAASMDPFLIGVLQRVMLTGGNLSVNGGVSRSLLFGLKEWQAAWLAWKPARYKPVRIRPKFYSEDINVDRTDGLLAFSGGVGALYSLAKAMAPTSEGDVYVRRLLLVIGLDIGLGDEEASAAAVASATALAAAADCELAVLRTNVRQFIPYWEDGFALAVAASLHFGRNTESHGLIASSEPYAKLILPWGSNPVTDHLLSSNAFRIVHDGASASRQQKVDFIANWPLAKRYVRVCWQADSRGNNCGKCEKCVRTRANFALAGVPSLEAVPSGSLAFPLVQNAAVLSEWGDILRESRLRRNFPVLGRALFMVLTSPILILARGLKSQVRDARRTLSARLARSAALR